MSYKDVVSSDVLKNVMFDDKVEIWSSENKEVDELMSES